jgi:MraZ protein
VELSGRKWNQEANPVGLVPKLTGHGGSASGLPERAATARFIVLTGSYLRSLDAKCRIALPKAIRDGFDRKSATDESAKSDAAKSDAAKSEAAKSDAAKSEAAESEAVYMTPGTDGSLDLYSPGEFHELALRIHARSSATDDGRAFRRLFYAQAQRVDIDRQGRFRIPSELMLLGNLSREVMLLGVGDHLEMWDPTRWKTYLAEKQLQFDKIAEKTLERPPVQGSS